MPCLWPKASSTWEELCQKSESYRAFQVSEQVMQWLIFGGTSEYTVSKLKSNFHHLSKVFFLFAPLRRYTGVLCTDCSHRLQISVVILWVSRFPCSLSSLLKIKNTWVLEYVVRVTAFLFSEVNLILKFTLANPDFAVLCTRELHTSHFIFISAEHHNVLYLTVLCRLQYISIHPWYSNYLCSSQGKLCLPLWNN